MQDYEKRSWRTRELFTKSVLVYYRGMRSWSDDLVKHGWNILKEYNRYTGKSKLIFTNPDGLIAKVPFNEAQIANSINSITIPQMYHFKNYKIKPAKITELDLVVDIVDLIQKEDIPLILAKIRELGKEEALEFIMSQPKEDIQSNIIEFAKYLKQKKEVENGQSSNLTALQS